MARRRTPPPGVTCYACDAQAVTWEHAPARAFYPKRGEVRLPQPRDLRTRLIQVPSCDEHNNGKSRTDNYVASYIVTVAASLVGVVDPRIREPFVDRHIETVHRGRRLSEDFFGARLSICNLRGEFVPISPDVDAIHEFALSTAMAVYYDEGFKKTGSWESAPKWPGGSRVLDMQLVQSDGSPHPDHQDFLKIESAFEALRERGHEGGERRGPHPPAFFYQLLYLPDGRPAIRLVFYEAYRILVLPEAKTAAAATQASEDGGCEESPLSSSTGSTS